MNSDAALAAGIAALGLQLRPFQRKQLLTYIGLLAKWNEVYNLTAIREPSEVARLHVLDSLTAAPLLRDLAVRGHAP